MRNPAHWKLFAVLAAFLAAGLASASATERPWTPLGPDGGSVRSLAYDPQNPDQVFLGTSAGMLYVSRDHGSSWTRLAHFTQAGGGNAGWGAGEAGGMALDNIVVSPTDSKTIYVAAWSVAASTIGELFRSRDGGKHWEATPDMHNQSIRALALAPSDPKILVAGTLEGVFRSHDGGERWERISPEHHAEIKNVESIAIDPAHPETIYAGTWHLPWKTEDGGQTWRNIKQGVIDDSDVFSIIIDPAKPSVVFASACSGIYKSESAGDAFHKIQGIPYSARRTRVLEMDPGNHDVVFAGTTEGLWKTLDAGATWKRMTGANLVVNAVLIDPRNSAHVLLATDRGGVLASEDGAATFKASNHGFAHRQVASLLADRGDGSILYAGLLNDKEFGGVFISHDAGRNWEQAGEGLEGRDVFVLRQAEDGSIVAGTNRGVFILNTTGLNTTGLDTTPNAAVRWQPLGGPPASGVEADADHPNPQKNAGRTGKNHAATRPKPPAITESRISDGRINDRRISDYPINNSRINDLQLGPERWFAATSAGLFTSTDHGASWQDAGLPGSPDLTSVGLADRMVAVSGRHVAFVSVNGGESWLPARLSEVISAINAIAVDSEGTLWIAAREGAFRSTNAGDSWQPAGTLPLSNVVSIQYDPEQHRLLAAGEASTGIFESVDRGRAWRRTDSGWPLRNLSPAHGRLIAATTFDGLVMQPGDDHSSQ